MPKAKMRPDAGNCSVMFHAAQPESIFPVLDAVAWMDSPDVKQIAQFSGLDARTVGKLLSNCIAIGVIDELPDNTYSLTLAYPFRGNSEQKKAVMREAMVRMPLVKQLKQFQDLGDNHKDALRKAATVVGVKNYQEAALAPLIKWASHLKALAPEIKVENLLEEAVAAKELRHQHDGVTTVFLSHSSKDKVFVRQLAGDLTKQGIAVWLDEQKIRVGDSIVDGVSQGLAESDYFVVVLSENSTSSEWVKRELNQALLKEIAARDVKVLPIKLGNCTIPPLLQEKKYADFSANYSEGLAELFKSLHRNK